MRSWLRGSRVGIIALELQDEESAPGVLPRSRRRHGTGDRAFFGALTGAAMIAPFVLAIMILPFIVSVSLDSLAAVPTTYREAALGLGATRWEMIRVAVWPSAKAGFFGGCILALGRALGETMAVTMVIGNGRRIGWSLLAASDTVASTIANQFAEAPSDLFTSSLIEMALLLFVTTLLVNTVARLITRRAGAE